jgi:autotransporter-associated beta strand protein
LAFGIQTDAQLTLEGSGSANLTISGPITGSGGVTMGAFSTVTLTGNHSYTGPTAVESGTLAVSGNLSGTESVTVGSGATLINTGVIETPDVTILSGGTLGGIGTIRGNVTVSGEVLVAGPGTWRVEGNVINTGTIRLTGGARLEVTGTLTNQGLLDLIMADQTFVGTIIDTGTVLDLSAMKAAPSISITASGVEVDTQTFLGHTFQLQKSTTLQGGSWTNVGAPQPGTGGRVVFIDPAGAALDKQFYRVIIVP